MAENYDPQILKQLKENHIIELTEPPKKYPNAKFQCPLCWYHMDDIDIAIEHLQKPFHLKHLKRLSTNYMLFNMRKPSKIHLEAINECLMAKLNEPIYISTEESQRRVDLIQKMNKCALEINPGNHLKICGSILTGLSLTDYSDVNIYFETHSRDNDNTDHHENLEKLSSSISELQLISHIKLERFKCGLFLQDEQKVSYHISVSNRTQLFSSQLIRLYLQIDDRAEKLAKLFRYFAKISFIDQVKDGFLPSEAFPILVIFYLQQLPVPILPNLHKLAQLNSSRIPETHFTRISINEHKYDYINHIDSIKELWKPPPNYMNLGELWIGLLRFYAIEFDRAKFVVSIRSTHPVMKSERQINKKGFSIEDPFNVKRHLTYQSNRDVIDRLTDQLHGCYKYFVVPQLNRGRRFDNDISIEIKFSTMKSAVNVIPISSKNSFTKTLDEFDLELKQLFEEQESLYDVSRWPVELFVKMCLSKILTLIFESPIDISNFITLLELETKQSHLAILNYEKFKEYSEKLAKLLHEEFSGHFEKTNSWGTKEMDTQIAYELINNFSIKFINEILNIVQIDEEEYASDFRGKEGEEFESDVQEDAEENNDDSWKLPIGFRQVFCNFEEDLVYNFDEAHLKSNKPKICPSCKKESHLEENCPSAVTRFCEKDLLRHLDEDYLGKLKEVLITKSDSITSNINEHERNKTFEEITKICESIYPSARPQLYGSSLSGFLNEDSDLDICVEFDEGDEHQVLQAKEVTNRLERIYKEIKDLPNINQVEFISEAKIPIIKFRINQTTVNVSADNSLGVENSKMLKLYGEMSTELKVLATLIKFVTKTCDIGNVYKGTLSSYAYILMLIHFLQKRKVLPVLQELRDGESQKRRVCDWNVWYQSEKSTIKSWKEQNPAKREIAYLWLNFFRYYAAEFNIDEEVVCIRQFKPLLKIDKCWQTSFIAIEDPFELSHNLGGHLNLKNCNYILECFAHVWRQHSGFEDPSRFYLSTLFEPENLIRKDSTSTSTKRSTNQILNSQNDTYGLNQPHNNRNYPAGVFDNRNFTPRRPNNYGQRRNNGRGRSQPLNHFGRNYPGQNGHYNNYPQILNSNQGYQRSYTSNRQWK